MDPFIACNKICNVLQVYSKFIPYIYIYIYIYRRRTLDKVSYWIKIYLWTKLVYIYLIFHIYSLKLTIQAVKSVARPDIGGAKWPVQYNSSICAIVSVV